MLKKIIVSIPILFVLLIALLSTGCGCSNQPAQAQQVQVQAQAQTQSVSSVNAPVAAAPAEIVITAKEFITTYNLDPLKTRSWVGKRVEVSGVVTKVQGEANEFGYFRGIFICYPGAATLEYKIKGYNNDKAFYLATQGLKSGDAITIIGLFKDQNYLAGNNGLDLDKIEIAIESIKK